MVKTKKTTSKKTAESRLWKKRKDTEVTLNSKAVANVNTNHASGSYKHERLNLRSDDHKKESLKGSKVKIKSKVVIPSTSAGKTHEVETVNFAEEGEDIQMEISDGRAAALEFGSDEDMLMDNQTSDSESEGETED